MHAARPHTARIEIPLLCNLISTLCAARSLVSSLTLLIASAAAVPGFGPLAPVAAVLNEEAGRHRTQTSRARRLVLHLPRGHTEPILVEFDSGEEMYPGIPAAHAQRRWLLVEPVGRPAPVP